MNAVATWLSVCLCMSRRCIMLKSNEWTSSFCPWCAVLTDLPPTTENTTFSSQFQRKLTWPYPTSVACHRCQRRNVRGDGVPDPPTLFWRGGTDPLTFCDHVVPKHDVYQRSIVKACNIALWWVAVRMYISWLPSSQFLHAIAMIQQLQRLLAFSNKCSNIQSALVTAESQLVLILAFSVFVLYISTNCDSAAT